MSHELDNCFGSERIWKALFGISENLLQKDLDIISASCPNQDVFSSIHLNWIDQLTNQTLNRFLWILVGTCVHHLKHQNENFPIEIIQALVPISIRSNDRENQINCLKIILDPNNISIKKAELDNEACIEEISESAEKQNEVSHLWKEMIDTCRRMNCLVVLDGTFMFFKSFYVTKSEEMGCVIFLEMLQSYLKLLKPKRFVICLDSPYPLIKSARYPYYKEQRVFCYHPNSSSSTTMKSSMEKHFKNCEILLSMLQMQTIQEPGYEADDIVSQIIKKWVNISSQNRSIIVSIDKDFYQLVSNQVWFLKIPGSSRAHKKIYTPEKVQEEFQVRPEQFVDYQCLVGDLIDGVKGIGMSNSRAVQLLTKYKTLQQIKQSGEIEPDYDCEELIYLLSFLDGDVEVSFDSLMFDYDAFDQQLHELINESILPKNIVELLVERRSRRNYKRLKACST